MTDPSRPSSGADFDTATVISAPDLHDWQTRVRNDSSAFLAMCDHMGLVPNLWALYEWSDWLTPVSVGHRRFDTIFYVCCMPSPPPVRIDNAEVTKPKVCPTAVDLFSRVLTPRPTHSGAARHRSWTNTSRSESSWRRHKSTNSRGWFTLVPCTNLAAFWPPDRFSAPNAGFR